jgi:hypothetical protein
MLAPHHEVHKHDLIPCHMILLLCKPGELSVQMAAHGTRLKKLGIEGLGVYKVFITSAHFCEKHVVSWHHWNGSKQASGEILYLDSPLSHLLYKASYFYITEGCISVQAFHCSPFSLRYLSATQNMSLAIAEKHVMLSTNT